MEMKVFDQILSQRIDPIILLEGTRALPEAKREKLIMLGEMLAKKYPLGIFRTGNASGSDEAFAEGVAKVDPTRLQYVLPYSGHRKKKIFPKAFSVALDAVADNESTMENLAQNTLLASPGYEDLLSKGTNIPRLKAKVSYLLRDTMKVVGVADELPGATVGIFFADSVDPMKGGTGHTIRVCRQNDIPVVLQNDWEQWLS